MVIASLLLLLLLIGSVSFDMCDDVFMSDGMIHGGHHFIFIHMRRCVWIERGCGLYTPARVQYCKLSTALTGRYLCVRITLGPM